MLARLQNSMATLWSSASNLTHSRARARCKVVSFVLKRADLVAYQVQGCQHLSPSETGLLRRARQHPHSEKAIRCSRLWRQVLEDLPMAGRKHAECMHGHPELQRATSWHFVVLRLLGPYQTWRRAQAAGCGTPMIVLLQPVRHLRCVPALSTARYASAKQNKAFLCSEASVASRVVREQGWS